MTDQLTTKKITANDTISHMIRAINSNRKDNFYKVAEQYCETFTYSSPIKSNFLHLISQKPMEMMRLDQLPENVKKLITSTTPTEENVFLNDDIKSLIDELLLEWQNAEVYNFHNLGIRNKILFHGPTGNGKTTVAKYIARMTKLPFVEINSDSVICGTVGATGKNIHEIFNQVNEPCVLFWDEVDTIGRKRSDGGSAAGVENERMVNSILVNIEKMSNDVIFIGATNRREILDPAFLRRFDVQFELTNPSSIEKERFLKQMLEYYKLPDSVLSTPIDAYNNYSEIKMMLIGLARTFVLSKLK